jgi:hypothetical protein
MIRIEKKTSRKPTKPLVVLGFRSRGSRAAEQANSPMGSDMADSYVGFKAEPLRTGEMVDFLALRASDLTVQRLRNGPRRATAQLKR